MSGAINLGQQGWQRPAAKNPQSPGSLRRSVYLAGFVAAASLTAVVFTMRSVGEARYQSAVYVALLYALVLPFMLLYWRHSRLSAQPMWLVPRIDLVAAIGFAVLAVMVAKSGAHEHTISDESAYQFQARVFAAGKLKAEPMPGAAQKASATPVEIYFEQTIQTPQGWFAKYPPGWPAVLAIGYRLHCAWLLNPVLGVLQLLLVWHLAKPLGRTTQMLSIFIAAGSAYMLVYSVGFLSHACDAVICLLALAAVLKGLRNNQLFPIVLAFLLIVFATQVRPYTGMLTGLLLAGIVLCEARNDRSFLFKSGVVILAAGATAIGLFLIVNYLFTGNALISPYALMHDGASIQELTFRPAKILYNLVHRWRGMITETVRVTLPFMFLFAIYGLWRERSHRRELWYLGLLFPLLIVAYLFQAQGSGSFEGERFYFEGFCPMAIVAARGFYLWCSEWQLARSAVLTTLGILTALQCTMTVSVVRDIETVLKPFKQAYMLAQSPTPPPLLFLAGDAPAFTSKHVNWNDADWPRARTIYLNDPGSGARDQVACRFGRPSYRVIQFDDTTHTFSKQDAVANCSKAE